MRKLVKRDNPFGLIDPFFDDFFSFGKRNLSDNQIMKTDIKEEDDHYLVKVDLPEIKKEDVKISLDNGYLLINATLENKHEEEEGRYIRRERHFGNFARSFYVGDELVEEDIKAKLDNGVLTLTLKKRQPQAKASKFIEIE